jgi:hypothetical protein
MKKMAISGSRGFIGSHLRTHFEAKGWTLVELQRNELYGDPAALAQKITGCEALIHLSGAPIIQRWTRKNRKRILDSRILTTANLAKAIERMETPPAVWLNASAVGLYPVWGEHSEGSMEVDNGFLGDVVSRWEAEAERAEKRTRLLLMRYGVVLGRDGGALPRLVRLFRLGLGGRLGSGKQPFPWIDIDDLVEGVHFLMESEKLSGPFNFTAPELVDNRAFTRTLAAVLKRPAFLPVPAFALRLLYGKAADTLLQGQKVIPLRLKEAGFSYRYPTLRESLASKTGSEK